MKILSKNEAGEQEMELGKGITQKVYLKPEHEKVASCDGKKIIINNKFKELSKEEQIAVIYHERGHLKRISRFLLLFSNIFYTILGFSLAIFLIKISLFSLSFFPSYLTSVLVLLKSFLPSYSYLIILFILGFVGTLSLRWLIEIYCDFNAIKNTNKEVFIGALNQVSEIQKKKKNLSNFIYWIPNKIDKIVLHPPVNLRIKWLKELD